MSFLLSITKDLFEKRVSQRHRLPPGSPRQEARIKSYSQPRRRNRITRAASITAIRARIR
jgi:hypothetical protein